MCVFLVVYVIKFMVICFEYSKVLNVIFKIRKLYKVLVMVILIYGIFFFVLLFVKMVNEYM